jgi:mRNA interferase RelE/StbE
LNHWSARLAWKIEFADSASRQLKKLDPPIARRIMSFLRERVAPAADPRLLGQALKGDELSQYWKYRVGDYRLIAEIHDRQVRIVVVRLGHRRDVYR